MTVGTDLKTDQVDPNVDQADLKTDQMQAPALQAAAESATIPHPLPDQLAEAIARRFRVLGEPMRIKLLDELRERDATVGDLRDALGASQQNVSKHLGILHDAGLVSRTKQGTSVIYAISDPDVFALCDEVCGGLRRQARALGEILAS